MQASTPTVSDHPELRPVNQTRSFATARSVTALILREMVTTYGRSPGGYLWAVLEPVAGILLMVVVFSLIMRSPPLGTNFAIFYATGLVPFMMFITISGKLAAALVFSRQLLVYPSVTFVDALLARFLLEFVTQLLVSYIIISGILLIWETQTQLHLPDIAMSFAMLAVLAFGIGTMNCFLTTRFEIWARIWAITTRPLVIISGIIFIPENVPEPWRTYLLYNPLVHAIAEMRTAYYPFYDAPYVSHLYVFGIGLVLSAFGLMLLLRYHRDLLNR